MVVSATDKKDATICAPKPKKKDDAAKRAEQSDRKAQYKRELGERASLAEAASKNGHHAIKTLKEAKLFWNGLSNLKGGNGAGREPLQFENKEACKIAAAEVNEAAGRFCKQKERQKERLSFVCMNCSYVHAFTFRKNGKWMESNYVKHTCSEAKQGKKVTNYTVKQLARLCESTVRGTSGAKPKDIRGVLEEYMNSAPTGTLLSRVLKECKKTQAECGGAEDNKKNNNNNNKRKQPCEVDVDKAVRDVERAKKHK
ncbi:hypothetical protein HOP50_01g09460 [Chloropicon primus]|uniref:Uncharacterized protein n=1 Tax=Chloropicon primus TaxID=1764295 RepID=A0A5B8MDV4_9CHLO|nr:hypothetical protein A3770_01p09590 [Chloropicon primus]UPQ97651.1 hypothetical protein HOP50_01g09460 [Chloropicon primus]|mmetsp:Transcript_13265/g.37230  ORF Transcript_13265/g.37230 Transcript_13265/m.37230 type:complete len:256 (+) Transcript_13265:278-1045(+)|eukprot:QDZ18441.1 hypothetical protein A3770_01p09590 [Chloropicon primus]